MIFNLAAIVLSVLALAISTYLALHQSQIQRRANYLSAYTGMFADFRSAAFHDRYLFVTETLPSAYDPQLGISGLPEEARVAIYDMAYFFQNLAQLRLLRILDEEIFAQLHIRIIRVWDAIAPFVQRERELHRTTGAYLLRILEDFAADARETHIGSVSPLLQRRRLRGRLGGRRLRRNDGRRGGAVPDPAGFAQAEPPAGGTGLSG